MNWHRNYWIQNGLKKCEFTVFSLASTTPEQIRGAAVGGILICIMHPLNNAQVSTDKYLGNGKFKFALNFAVTSPQQVTLLPLHFFPPRLHLCHWFCPRAVHAELTESHLTFCSSQSAPASLSPPTSNPQPLSQLPPENFSSSLCPCYPLLYRLDLLLFLSHLDQVYLEMYEY